MVSSLHVMLVRENETTHDSISWGYTKESYELYIFRVSTLPLYQCGYTNS